MLMMVKKQVTGTLLEYHDRLLGISRHRAEANCYKVPFVRGGVKEHKPKLTIIWAFSRISLS